MSLLPAGLLRNLELAAQLGQGKGWGTETIAREVRAGLDLLGDRPDGQLVVADVGANVGRWTSALLSAAPDAIVHAFEPGAEAFRELERNVAAHPGVHLHRAAVGSRSGKATLWSDTSGSVLASLERRDLGHRGMTFDHAEEVNVVALDEVFARCPPPSLVKIDVEGRELDVLAGAVAVLGAVRVVQFEFGGCNIDSRTYLRDFWRFFSNHGFRMYRLGPRGPRPMRRYSEFDETFSTTNFIAAR
jgi:FkbM family methyltransferase